VDRRLGQEVLKVISPLGVEASLKALEELSAGDAAQRATLSSKLEQLEYEAKKAFEQYDAVDARNRLVAGELERRWNEKLEEVETTKQRLSSLNGKRWSLSSDEEERIRLMGESFAESWQSDRCPPTLKKMIFRTAMEEIIVRADAENTTLQFTIHWNGGTHTQLKMERPRSATDTATPVETLEIIRRMAVRHGDDQIASVLNRLGHSTGKGKRWNQERVATARRNHSIPGQKRALPDPDRISLSEAARVCGVSHRTIERLVEAGLLKREQTTPRAPWEIRRADLDAEPVRSIVKGLLRTGKLMLQGGCAEISLLCSLKTKEMIMPGIMSEGSGEDFGPRCGAHSESRCRPRDAGGRQRPPTVSRRWNGTGGRRRPFYSAAPARTTGVGW